MNELVPTNSTHSPVLKPRISKRLKQAIDALCTGKARTQRQAANLAGLNEQHLSRMLRKPQIRSLLTRRGQEIIANAAPRAAMRIVEHMDSGTSEHVSLKAALRIAENEGVIQPSGNPAVNINLGQGNAGYIITLGARPGEAPPPLTPKEMQVLESGTPGLVRYLPETGDKLIDVTPNADGDA